MVRATLLYDSLVLRLDGTIDRTKEYARFRNRDRARWARERWERRTRATRGQLFLRLEELAQAGEDLMRRAQHTISSPTLRFRSFIEKWAFGVSVLSRTAGRLLVITAVVLAGVLAVRYARTGSIAFLDALRATLLDRTYQSVIFVAFVLNMRLLVFRLRDRDVGPWDDRRR
jgi:hypothetical protein